MDQRLVRMNFPPKLVWTNGAQRSLKVSVLTGILSDPNRAMQPRCAMRFESHTPKSLAMRKSFFSLAMREPISLI